MREGAVAEPVSAGSTTGVFRVRSLDMLNAQPPLVAAMSRPIKHDLILNDRKLAFSE
jgi:hypothetical protein